VFVFVAGGVCYHDNSKLRASIFTKLDLQVKLVTISSSLNFGGSAPPGKASAVAGGGGCLCLTTAIADSVRLWGTAAGAQRLRLAERFFIWCRFSFVIAKCLEVTTFLDMRHCTSE